MTNEMRLKIERSIAEKVLEALINAGYAVRVYDGEEFATKIPSKSLNELKKDIWSTDEDRFFCYNADGKKVAWVYIVYGNETDVISDYTTNLDDVLKPALDYADAIREGNFKMVVDHA